MTAHARDLVRAVYRTLTLRGGRDESLARDLENALVELEAAARGGASTLRSVDDAGDELEVELARLVSAMPSEQRATLVRLVLEVDGEGALRREVDRQRELEQLAASRALR